MIFLFKKKKQALFKGLIDFHNHILPGIDDGSKSIAQSLEMLNLFEQLEINTLIASPHIYKDLYPNTPDTISNAFDLLQNAAKSHPVNLRGYSAEYMVDEFFMAEVNKGHVLLPCLRSYLLLEIPFFGALKILDEALFVLLNKEYLPILAHPERYTTLKNINQVKDLKQKGAKMQLNALSLLGYYGKDIQKKASNWLKHGVYDFVCTDAHNPYQLKQLHKLKLDKKELMAWDGLRENHLMLFNN